MYLYTILLDNNTEWTISSHINDIQIVLTDFFNWKGRLICDNNVNIKQIVITNTQIDEKSVIVDEKLLGKISQNFRELNTPKDDIFDRFPFHKYFIKESELITRFSNLMNFIPNFVKVDFYKINNMQHLTHFETLFLPDKSPVLLLYKSDNYHKYDLISDYFIEDCRIFTKRYDQSLTLLEYWSANKHIIKQKAMDTFNNTDFYSLRESLFSLYHEVGTFRPTNIVSIIRKFNSKSVLDFSAGWGDRLIGSLACNVDLYCGVDPNTCVFNKYTTITNFFKKHFKINTNTIFINSPFEDAILPNDTYFDLICTSPPYFNLENYSNEDTQSINKYPLLDDWYDKFLITSIKKAWKHLRINGHMVIIINDIFNKDRFVSNMIDAINSFEDSLYLGVISYTEESKIKKSPQPMWIWKKIHYELNPTLVIQQLNTNNINFNVVRDDLLFGGTKQRAFKMFESITQKTLVYAGPSNGCAQVALAVIAKKYNKKAKIFLSINKNQYHNLTIRARMLGANIQFINNAPLKLLQSNASNFVNSDTHNHYLVPFGLENSLFKDTLYSQIIDASKNTALNDRFSKFNFWLVAGSATLLHTLYKVFPNSTFNVIQVGKTIWPDMINDRTKLYIAPEPFYSDAVSIPPYPTVSSYDAKLWQFFIQDGKEGDFIWNVCYDNSILPSNI
jgi:hypothetical protein